MEWPSAGEDMLCVERLSLSCIKEYVQLNSKQHEVLIRHAALCKPLW